MKYVIVSIEWLSLHGLLVTNQMRKSKDGSKVILHLKGTAGSTTYEIVGQNSVGHWFSKNKIKDFYSPERIIFNKNSNITASIISYDEEKKNGYIR